MVDCLTEQQQELVEKNHNLIYGFANRHKLPIDEYYDILAIGLCKAAQKYNNGNGVFSTFAYTCMKNVLFNYWKKNNAMGAIPDNKIVSYDTPNLFDNVSSNNGYINCLVGSDYTCDTAMSNMMYESFCDLLTDSEKIIVKLLMDSIPQIQIAERMGYTRQSVGYYISQIRKKLTKYLETC